MSAYGPATHEDFAHWEHLARSLHIDSLRHAIRDCYAAAKMIGTHDKVREGYYLDQAMTFEQEVRRRKGKR
jgi:hypothetical protein